MTITRKETAWKKSRKFGDVKGGRTRPKNTDGIFARYHSIDPPAPNDTLPIVFKDNPSRDFFFPVSEEEILEKLKQLPNGVTDGITHVWLRRVKGRTEDTVDLFQAMFICGSGVNLIVLNAFAKDLRMHFGPKKPGRKQLRFYSAWTESLIFDDRSNSWCLQWENETIKDYYLNHLILHEVGHFVDRAGKRFWSKASDKKKEDFADAFAVMWSSGEKQFP